MQTNTVIDANSFSIGVDTTTYTTYTSGGTASRIGSVTVKMLTGSN